MTLSCGSPLRSALIRRLRHQTACSLASKATDEGGRYCSRSSPCCVARKDSCKRLPLGGKLSRQRLMRGDQSALPIGCIFPRTGTTHGSFRSVHQLTSYRFYPVAERSDSCPNPAGRDLARSSRKSQHGIWLHQNLHNVKKET